MTIPYLFKQSNKNVDTEGMATSVSKLRDEIMSLSGVDIMLDDETFKSSYDILIGIGEVWDNLSDINRANITELLFGKRRTIVSIYGDVYCKTHLIAGTSFWDNLQRSKLRLERSTTREMSSRTA